jgi:hypothetical protein
MMPHRVIPAAAPSGNSLPVDPGHRAEDVVSSQVGWNHAGLVADESMAQIADIAKALYRRRNRVDRKAHGTIRDALSAK